MTNHRRLIAVLCAFTVAISTAAGTGLAEESSNPAPQAAPRPTAPAGGADLPVREVVLFSSGVGFVRHLGQVQGDQTVTLFFRDQEVNDLLKSAVVQDWDGGTVRAIRYPSQDPLGRVLSSYSIDLSRVDSLRELLDDARGEPVVVDAPSVADAALRGTLFAVDQRPDEQGVMRDVVVIMGATGLQSVGLDAVRSVQFTDGQLQSDLEQALATIAGGRQTDKKPVRFEFTGSGTRRVAIAYVREMPVWKTTYRLLLDDDGAREGTAQLQGWGIAENTTDQDWVDVSLAFVAGQPISFAMNLLDPVYVRRPVVEVAQAPSIAAPEYETALRAAPSARASAPMATEAADLGLLRADRLPATEASAAGSRAEAAQAGGFFQYRIDEPVSVPRHQSAMIPIVDAQVSVEQVSIYDRSVLAANPLRGVILENTTGLHLAAGPVTVIRDDGYGGDARFADLLPGQRRQLSFAVDIDLLVNTEQSAEPEQITRVAIRNGVLTTTRLRRMATTYTAANSAAESRTLIVEHPRTSGWELSTPAQAWETTPTRYRLRMSVPAGDTASLRVVEERTDREEVALLDVQSSRLLLYVSQDQISAAVRQALERIVAMRNDLADLTNQRRELETQINDIYRAQERISRNMESLDHDSALYTRYLEELTEQEDRLDILDEQIARLRTAEQAKQTEIREFISSIEIE